MTLHYNEKELQAVLMKEYDLWILTIAYLDHNEKKRIGELRGRPYPLPAQRRITFLSKG